MSAKERPAKRRRIGNVGEAYLVARDAQSERTKKAIRKMLEAK